MCPYLNIFGVTIPTYGLCMAIGIVTVSLASYRQAGKRKLNKDDLIILIACVVGMALLGAVILFDLVTYGPIGFVKELLHSGIKKFAVNSGMVFYGGLLGGFLGLPLAKKITGADPTKYYLAVVPFIPIGHAMGRIGCFCAGCCYGIPSDSLFAVHFPHAVTGLSPEVSVIPTQLIEVVCDLLIAVYLVLKYQRHEPKDDRKVLSEYIALYAMMRFLIEFLRGDAMRGRWWLFSTSQWISLGLLVFVGILSVYRKKITSKKQ